MILTATLAIPLLGSLLLALWPKWQPQVARLFATLVAAVPLVLLIIVWIRFDPEGTLFQQVEEAPWIPSLGMGFRLGVDGISLAVSTMSALLFIGATLYPVDTKGLAARYYGWMLFLEGVSLGLFLSLDLLLFYVFFDLNLVGMYFLIGHWGHGRPQYAALKFFLYTFVGSLALLLAILALYLSSTPLSFDMRVLIEQQPLAGTGLLAGFAMLGFVIGFAIKTPLVPFHTWLPPAHVDAPAPASAILAGVLLKMGTFGLIRVPYSMMRETFAAWAPWLALLALVSILYGALVALAQTDMKRRIAYTSINHMGYTVLGIAVAGALLEGGETVRQLALIGATVEMVAHGLITGSLFLITGSFWQRGKTYELSAYGGLGSRAPGLTGMATLAAFASLGLPGLAGFVAEFHIFVGTFGVYPWLAALALLGILITAGLFLHMLQRLFFGQLPAQWAGFADLHPTEWLVLGVLLAWVVIIGVYPSFLLALIDPTARLLVGGA